MVISTAKRDIEGDVKKKPKMSFCTIDLSYEHLRSCSDVLSMKVERFNEMNVTLERRKRFICKILSRNTVNLNAFQEFFYHNDSSKILTSEVGTEI